MTNADKIRQMTDEELVEFLDGYDVVSVFCPSEKIDCKGENDCERCWLKWLRSECDEI